MPYPAAAALGRAPSVSGTATLSVAAAGTLPYTGLGLVAVALLGLWLFAGGLVLWLVPGGKRR